MDSPKKILDEVSTILSQTNGQILGDIYARGSVTRRGIVGYKDSLTRALQLLEKLEEIVNSRAKPDNQ
jgi:hypothetical protein